MAMHLFVRRHPSPIHGGFLPEMSSTGLLQLSIDVREDESLLFGWKGDLTVCVARAKLNAGSLPNPYVKVHLTDNDRPIKTSKTKSQRQRKTDAPNFGNETLVVAIPNRACLRADSSVRLHVSIWDHQTMHTCMGVCSFGLASLAARKKINGWFYLLPERSAAAKDQDALQLSQADLLLLNESCYSIDSDLLLLSPAAPVPAISSSSPSSCVPSPTSSPTFPTIATTTTTTSTSSPTPRHSLSAPASPRESMDPPHQHGKTIMVRPAAVPDTHTMAQGEDEDELVFHTSIPMTGVEDDASSSSSSSSSFLHASASRDDSPTSPRKMHGGSSSSITHQATGSPKPKRSHTVILSPRSNSISSQGSSCSSTDALNTTHERQPSPSSIVSNSSAHLVLQSHLNKLRAHATHTKEYEAPCESPKPTRPPSNNELLACAASPPRIASTATSEVADLRLKLLEKTGSMQALRRELDSAREEAAALRRANEEMAAQVEEERKKDKDICNIISALQSVQAQNRSLNKQLAEEREQLQRARQDLDDAQVSFQVHLTTLKFVIDELTNVREGPVGADAVTRENAALRECLNHMVLSFNSMHRDGGTFQPPAAPQCAAV